MQIFDTKNQFLDFQQYITTDLINTTSASPPPMLALISLI